jgi:hypothetical protein
VSFFDRVQKYILFNYFKKHQNQAFFIEKIWKVQIKGDIEKIRAGTFERRLENDS